MKKSKSDYSEFINESLGKLKDFQKDTVMYVYKKLYEEKRDKFLVADEVGLGKTIVARGVIVKAFEKFKPTKNNPTFNVVYICSNQTLAHENLRKLNFTNEDEAVDNPLDRLIYLALKPEKSNSLIKFDSLTPSTSIKISNRTGTKFERAILYSLLVHNKSFLKKKIGLSWILKGKVETDNWRKTKKEFYDFRKLIFRRDIFKRFKQTLLKEEISFERTPKIFMFLKEKKGISIWKALLLISKIINGSNYQSFDIKNEIIVILRHLLTKLCLEYLSADIIILDEFQRYSDILGTKKEEKISQAIELAQAVFELKNTKVLMLSATPFKSYTTQNEEDRGENHYEEFIRVLKFLMKNHDTDFWNVFEKDRKEFFDALHNPKNALHDITNIIKVKMRLEKTYKEGVLRTERNLVSDDHNALIKNELKTLPINKDYIKDFIILDQINQKLRDTGRFRTPSPIEFSKSCPFPLSFLEGYQMRDNLVLMLKNSVFKKYLRQNKNAWISLKEIKNYKPLGKGSEKSLVPNSKMQYLLESTVHTDSWQWLWIPPTINYYKPKSIYPENSDFSKTLIFSSWLMVPRAISTILSYEAERLAITKYYKVFKEDKPETYFTENKKRKPRPLLTFKYSREKKSPLSMSLFTILFPCRFLAEVYDPELNLKSQNSLDTILNEIEIKIRNQFNNLNLKQYVSSKGESDKWYWAAQLLLDYKSSFQDKYSIEDLLRDISNPEIESEDYQKGEGLTSENEEHHIQKLTDFVKDPHSFNLGPIPEDLFKILAYICLASPAVVFLRSVKKFTKSTTKDNFDYAYLYAISKMHFLNKPENISIVRSSFPEEQIYWKSVLKYCLNGNIQSSVDEYIQLLMDSEGLENSEKLQTWISNVLDIKTVNIKVDDYQSFSEKKSKRIRTNYAVDFGNQNLETESGTGRLINIRHAFNSPFRPFILASTSIGQEGLDFHYYCKNLLHWNLPGNAIDIEQREGRINRYKGHIIRLNISRKYLDKIRTKFEIGSLWNSLYEIAEKEEGKKRNKCQLVPFWHVEPVEDLKIKRIIPFYPFSKDIEKFRKLSETLLYYRLTFGQPRQEELIESFQKHGLTAEEIEILSKNIIINLSPLKKR